MQVGGEENSDTKQAAAHRFATADNIRLLCSEITGLPLSDNHQGELEQSLETSNLEFHTGLDTTKTANVGQLAAHLNAALDAARAIDKIDMRFHFTASPDLTLFTNGKKGKIGNTMGFSFGTLHNALKAANQYMDGGISLHAQIASLFNRVSDPSYAPGFDHRTAGVIPLVKEVKLEDKNTCRLVFDDRLRGFNLPTLRRNLLAEDKIHPGAADISRLVRDHVHSHSITLPLDKIVACVGWDFKGKGREI